MPYKLRKAPKKELYWVITIETGKKHSKLPIPLDKAKAQMRVLESALDGGMLGAFQMAQKKKKEEVVKGKGSSCKPPAPNRSSGRASVFALTCIDPRYAFDVAYMLNHKKELHADYDLFTSAGASVGAQKKEWTKAFFDNLALGIQLHGVSEVWCFDHLDCGMYKATFGLKDDMDPKIHIIEMDKLQKLVKKKHPSLKFRKFIVQTNGDIEEVTGMKGGNKWTAHIQNLVYKISTQYAYTELLNKILRHSGSVNRQAILDQFAELFDDMINKGLARILKNGKITESDVEYYKEYILKYFEIEIENRLDVVSGRKIGKDKFKIPDDQKLPLPKLKKLPSTKEEITDLLLKYIADSAERGREHAYTNIIKQLEEALERKGGTQFHMKYNKTTGLYQLLQKGQVKFESHNKKEVEDMFNDLWTMEKEEEKRKQESERRQMEKEDRPKSGAFRKVKRS